MSACLQLVTRPVDCEPPREDDHVASYCELCDQNAGAENGENDTLQTTRICQLMVPILRAERRVIARA